MDNNQSGSIDFQEFMYYMIFLFTDSKIQKAEFIFKFIDNDNTNVLSKENLIQFYKIIDKNEDEFEYNDQELQLALLVLSKFNKKINDTITKSEFKNFYCNQYQDAVCLFNFLSVDAAANRELQVSKYSSNQVLKQLVKIEFDLYYLEKKLFPEKQESSFKYFNRQDYLNDQQQNFQPSYQSQPYYLKKQKSQKIFDSMIHNYNKDSSQKKYVPQQTMNMDYSKNISIDRIIQKIKKEVQQTKKLVFKENRDLFLKKNFVYQIEENFSRKQSRRASIVFFQNTNWNLATTLVQGIGKGLKIIEDDRDHQLSKNDFNYCNKIQFDCIFSTEFNSCKFKDYQPYVFQKIRKCCGIRDEEYLKSIGVNTFKNAFFEKLNFFFSEQSSGKSGSFFFHTFDGKYLIKTIKRSEFKVLKESLRDYFYYLQDNPYTLLPKYYGLHRIKCYQGKKLTHEVFIIVSKNVFDTTRPDQITDTYDLKGSKQGRYTKEENYKNGAAKKDLNFIKEKKILFLEANQRKQFLEQLDKDSKFLQQLKLIDYSLLLGIQKNPNLQRKCEKFNQILDKKNNRKYFIGIIDSLTDFGLTKTSEYIAKRIIHGKQMSCVPPEYYQKRFMKFMNKIIKDKPKSALIQLIFKELQLGEWLIFKKKIWCQIDYSKQNMNQLGRVIQINQKAKLKYYLSNLKQKFLIQKILFIKKNKFKEKKFQLKLGKIWKFNKVQKFPKNFQRIQKKFLKEIKNKILIKQSFKMRQFQIHQKIFLKIKMINRKFKMNFKMYNFNQKIKEGIQEIQR